MVILLADPDRDFLGSFKAWGEGAGDRVDTVFDGVQAATAALSGQYDAAVIGEGLPRMSLPELLLRLKQAQLPTVLLKRKPLRSKDLLSPQLPEGVLPFPFFPSELQELCRRVEENRRLGGEIRFGDVRIDRSAFQLCGVIPVTAGEILLFESLLKGEFPGGHLMELYADSLNHKLKHAGKSVRIIYKLQEGYRLVNENE